MRSLNECGQDLSTAVTKLVEDKVKAPPPPEIEHLLMPRQQLATWILPTGGCSCIQEADADVAADGSMIHHLLDPCISSAGYLTANLPQCLQLNCEV